MLIRAICWSTTALVGKGKLPNPQAVVTETCKLCCNNLPRIRPLSTSRALHKRDDLKLNNANIIKTSTLRQGRMFKNMMFGGGKKSKQFGYSQPVSHHLKDFGFLSSSTESQQEKGQTMSGRVRRRVDVLNNLFVEQITGLLATGEVSPEFLGLGIQISKVKTIPDFSAIHVYWYASGSEKDETIETLLTGAAGHLRHILSQLRVVGVVPPIKFFKDETYSKLQEVEELLSKCDFGSDYKPTAVIHSGCSSASKVSSILERESHLGSEAVEVVMRQDTLGVRHDLIMGEIVKSLQQKRERKLAREKNLTQPQPRSISDTGYLEDIHSPDQNESADDDSSPKTALETAVDDHRKRQNEFLKYLKKRKAEKEKKLKLESEEVAHRNLFLEEKQERYKSELEQHLKELVDNEDENDDKDDDTYDDDDDAYYELEQKYYDSQRERFKYE